MERIQSGRAAPGEGEVDAAGEVALRDQPRRHAADAGGDGLRVQPGSVDQLARGDVEGLPQRTQRGCSADAARMQSGRIADTERMQSGRSADTERMQSGRSADTERMQSGRRADTERMQSDAERTQSGCT